MEAVYQQLIEGVAHTSLLEWIAALAGIISVWFSRKENIWVYPVGLINTTFYIYLSFKYHLPGEALVNLYYTAMSLYGWYWWLKKTSYHTPVLHISFSDKKTWQNQILFFLGIFTLLFLGLTFLKNVFFDGAIPWADALASASAFVGMWLMARKKVESWYWWLLTNTVSIPLFFVKGMVVTSIYYVVLFTLAIGGLISWKQKAKTQQLHD